LEGWEIPNAPTSISNLKSARSAATSDLVNAQVESVNIVGYTTKALTANQKAITGAQFVEVGGGTSLSLSSIKLVNVPAYGTASIKWWNGTGYEGAAWMEIMFDPDDIGWGDGLTAERVEHTFAPGEGFWIVLPSGVTDAAVIQSGEVKLSTQATYDFALEANKKSLIINPLPVAISLADIELVNVPAYGTASIKWWNGNGYDGAAWMEIMFDPDDVGWGDGLTAERVTHTFGVDEGFWIVLPSGVTDPAVKIANKVL
jgi:hypothetical protein